MLDIYDSMTLIKIYRLLEKKCDAIDQFINNHAFSFTGYEEEFDAYNVCNNIIELMTRKNQLINLKLIVDSVIEKLDDKDKKILYIKMRYALSTEELGQLLGLKQRTLFRRIERAYTNLTEQLNNSKHYKKLLKIIQSEIWVRNIKEDIKYRHPVYKPVSCEA